MPPPPARTATRRASLQQWMQRTPELGALHAQAQESQRLWALLSPSLPPPLAAAVHPAKYTDGVWVLGASSPAVAAKIKLYLPLWLRRLRQEGPTVQSITVRVRPAAAPAAPAAPPAVHASAAPPDVVRRLRALRLDS